VWVPAGSCIVEQAFQTFLKFAEAEKVESWRLQRKGLDLNFPSSSNHHSLLSFLPDQTSKDLSSSQLVPSPFPSLQTKETMASSSSPAGSASPAPSHSPLIGNPPEAGWIVQKYGGTSVGKFLDAITGNIIP